VRAACTPDAFVRLSRTRPCVGACIRLARVLAPRAAAEAGGGADGKGLSSKRAELLQKRWAPPPLGPASCARAGAGRRGNGSRAPLPPTHALCGARARPPCDGRACYACRHARRCRRLMHEVIARHVVEAAERVRAPAALLRAASKR
jgi:hypothetical protein